MFCPKCNKFYYKKSYFDKHIRSNDCIKKIISVDYRHSRITTELLLAQINSLHDRIANLEESLSKVQSAPIEKTSDQQIENATNQDKRLALIVYKNINPNRAIKNEKIHSF